MLELVYSHVSSLFGEEGARHRWWLDKLGREGEEGWVLEEAVGAYWMVLELCPDAGREGPAGGGGGVLGVGQVGGTGRGDGCRVQRECEVGDLGFEDTED